MKRQIPLIMEGTGIFVLVFAVLNTFNGWLTLNSLSKMNKVNVNMIVIIVKTISLFYMGKLALNTSKNFLYGERDARERFLKNGITYILLKYLYLGLKFILIGEVSIILSVLPNIFLSILFYNIFRFVMYNVRGFNDYFAGKIGTLTKSKESTVFNEITAIIKKLKEMVFLMKKTESQEKLNSDNMSKDFNRNNMKTREIDKIIIEKLEINQKIKTHSVISDGGFRNYFDNGLLSTEGHYKNGKLQDRYVQYFRNGRIHEEGYYQDGKKSGKWKTFEENGKLLIEEEF